MKSKSRIWKQGLHQNLKRYPEMTIKLLENIRTVNQNPDSYRGWVEQVPIIIEDF
jgi:hypothetical protein